MRRRTAALAAALVLCRLAGSATAQGSRRVALLIGNASYGEGALRNPINDVRAIAPLLQAAGFAVATRENLKSGEMRDALRTFVLTHRADDVRLVYYAGHGLQMRGRSYLLPIGARVANEGDLLATAIDATELVEQLGEIRHGANLVVIDACRVPPVFQVGARDLWAARPGLAPVAAPRGTVVAFSTRPGQVARDGAEGTLGVYARHFTRALQEQPQLPVEVFLKRVRAGVSAETRNRQVPWESSDLNGELCFRPNVDGRCRRTPSG